MNTELNTKETDQPISRDRGTSRPMYLVEGDKENYKIRVFMPGVSKDHYNISLHRGELSVEGHKDTSIAPGARWLHRETVTNDYKLRLQLNVEVDEDAISATSEDGVLLINLPVAKEARPRQIQIS